MREKDEKAGTSSESSGDSIRENNGVRLGILTFKTHISRGSSEKQA
jgi:hypothetical protein